MKFYIKIMSDDKYIWTEIDSSGMSAWLTKYKEEADSWDSKEGAEGFVKRLAEPASKFRNDTFEIVQ